MDSSGKRRKSLSPVTSSVMPCSMQRDPTFGSGVSETCCVGDPNGLGGSVYRWELFQLIGVSFGDRDEGFGDLAVGEAVGGNVGG